MLHELQEGVGKGPYGEEERDALLCQEGIDVLPSCASLTHDVAVSLYTKVYPRLVVRCKNTQHFAPWISNILFIADMLRQMLPEGYCSAPS